MVTIYSRSNIKKIMIIEIHQDNCSIKSTLDKSSTLSLVDKSLLKTLNIQHTFKDDKKIHVFLFDFQGKKYIYKEPRERNNRKWERFLTLFRPSESTRFFNSYLKLLELGLKCPTPILSYEEIKLGMVVRSFFIYEFIEGDPAYPPHKEIVFEELKKLHKLGYTRRDPNLNNFLINDKGIYFIDFKINKPLFFKQTRIKLEKIYFNKHQPPRIEPTRKLNLPVEKNFTYILANFFLKAKGKSNSFKYKVKNFFKGKS